MSGDTIPAAATAVSAATASLSQPLRVSQTATLELIGVSVAAGGGAIPLLENIDLTLHAGELIAVTGPSGCGKTTLLRAVCGLDDPAAGRILLQNRPAAEWGFPQFRRRVLYVTQQPALLDTTVDANLRLPFSYRLAASSGTAFPAQRAKELLERLGIGGAAERLGQNARSLSVGQQQRLCLIRALLLEPPVLLLDEPTSALDADAAAQVETLIREESERRGLAALIVTHAAAQAEDWWHRRFDLSGHIAAGRPAEKDG